MSSLPKPSCGHLTGKSRGLFPLRAVTPHAPAPCLGLRKALLSQGGKERELEKGRGPEWTQASGDPGLHQPVSALCCGQESPLDPPFPQRGLEWPGRMRAN